MLPLLLQAGLGAATGGVSPVAGAVLGGLSGLRGGLPGIAGGVLGGLQQAQQSGVVADQADAFKAMFPLQYALGQLGVDEETDRKSKRQLGQEFMKQRLLERQRKMNEESQTARTGAAESSVSSPLEFDTEESLASSVASPLLPGVTPINQPAPAANPIGGAGQRIFDRGSLQDPETGAILPRGLPGFFDAIRHVEGTTEEDAKKHGYESPYDVTLDRGAYLPDELKRVKLTDKKLSEIYEIQTGMLEHPDNKWNSSALGAGQFTRTTLFGTKDKPGLVQEMGLTPDTVFSKELQDEMMLRLAQRRGLDDFASGKISLEQFHENLKDEWSGTKFGYMSAGDTPSTPNSQSPELPANVQADPLGLSELPVEQMNEVLQYAADDMREQIRQYGYAALEQRDTMSAAANQGSGALFDNDALEYLAGLQVAYGNPQEQALGFSMLQGLQTRRDALGEAGSKAVMEAQKQIMLAAGGDLEFARQQSLKVTQAALDVEKAKVQHELDKVKQAESNAQTADASARIAEYKHKLTRRDAAIDAAQKDLARQPELAAAIHKVRDSAGSAGRALQLLDEMGKTGSFAGTGLIWSKLPGTGPGAELRQLFETMTLGMNAHQIKETFQGNPTVQESMIGLYELGPSSKKTEAVNVELLKERMLRLLRALDQMHGEYVGITGQELPITPGTQYHQLRAREMGGAAVDAFISGEDLQSLPSENNLSDFRDTSTKALFESIRKRRLQESQPVERPVFRGRR